MKNIAELTEQEILALTEDDINLMIKVKMAEEGIKFTNRPQQPMYATVPLPDTTVYYCPLLGYKLSFTDMNELMAVIELLSKCKTQCSVDSNYNLADGNRYFLKEKLENAGYSSDTWNTVIPLNAYSNKTYREAHEMLKENAKIKAEYDTLLKEHNTALDDAQWVSDEIWGRFNEVHAKYNRLNGFVWKFNNEYLPLSENNEEVAMKFMNKAYSLTEEEQQYVLTNYQQQ